MSIVVHLLLAWAYLLGGVLVFLVAGAEHRRWRQRRRARRAARAVPYLPLVRAQRAHPSNVRRIDTLVRVGGQR